MKKTQFYWFILIYALIVIYDGFYGYIYKADDEIIVDAVVSKLDRHKEPIMYFEFEGHNFSYKDPYANNYFFVRVGETVKLKFKVNKAKNYLTNIEIIDFKYQLCSINKLIYHIIILLLSYLTINKINSQI